MNSPDPSLFIGSSAEGLPVAQALQAELDEDCEALVWSQNFFGPTETTIGALMEKAQGFDFAVLVLTPDDSAVIRAVRHHVVRDNVLLELGIFLGALGTRRVFILHPREQGIRLPDDLACVTCLTYRNDRRDRNLRAAVGPAATAIRERIFSEGICSRRRELL